jgi:hypothetical protein
MNEEIRELILKAYHAGFVDGLATYAIYRDGEQVVGCLDKPLRKAQEEAKQAHNYLPRTE